MVLDGGKLAIIGSYPASGGYCSAPAHPYFIGSLDYALAVRDFDLIWSKSFEKSNSHEDPVVSEDIRAQRRLTDFIARKFADPSTWKDLLTIHILENFGDFVSDSLRTGCESRTANIATLS